MRRHTLAIAFVLAASAACGDSTSTGIPTIKSQPSEPTRPVPEITTLAGRLVVDEEMSDGTIRLVWGTSEIALTGSVDALRGINGADVIVFGSYVDGTLFTVMEFEVNGMNGLPTYDGLLEVQEENCTLLLRDGTYHVINSAPAELIALAGARVWVAVDEETGVPTAFGVITPRVPVE